MPICKKCNRPFRNQFDNIEICPDCVIGAENAVLRDTPKEGRCSMSKIKFGYIDVGKYEDRIAALERENADLKTQLAELREAAAWDIEVRETYQWKWHHGGFCAEYTEREMWLSREVAEHALRALIEKEGP